jgi:hypothetical protein
MASKAKNRRKRLGKKACITLPEAPRGYNGDHGTGTQAAMSGTRLVPIASDPNRRAYRQRVDVYLRLDLDARQAQTAKLIRDAYCRVEMLSSGQPLKERVQASAKPDQTIDRQVDAQSRLVHVMRAVPRAHRAIVEHVLWHNRPLRSLDGFPRSGARLRASLDAVADFLEGRR